MPLSESYTLNDTIVHAPRPATELKTSNRGNAASVRAFMRDASLVTWKGRSLPDLLQPAYCIVVALHLHTGSRRLH